MFTMRYDQGGPLDHKVIQIVGRDVSRCMQMAGQTLGLDVVGLPLRLRSRPAVWFGIRMPADAEIARNRLAGMIEAIAASQDRAAFAALFDHFAPRIKGFLMRGKASAAAAEELAQEAMLTVWRKAGQFDRSRASASAWVFAIARNLRIDSARREQRAQLLAFDLRDDESPAPPDSDMLATERDEQVRTALSQLSDEQARVVKLSFFDGMAHGDIADTLKLPLGTVKSRLRLAMKRLRELLDEP